MVVMNWQCLDKGMMLHEGMFTDQLGWILKPEGYRSDLASASSSREPPVEAEKSALKQRTLALTITLFAGHIIQSPMSDALDRLNSYVTCELHLATPDNTTGSVSGRKRTQKPGMYKQRSRPSKGLNPDFQCQQLHFPRVLDVAEELSFLR